MSKNHETGSIPRHGPPPHYHALDPRFADTAQPKLHSTNLIERLNKEARRRADVVGIFPNEACITGLVGAILLEQNDEWQPQHRYMTLETMAGRIDEQLATLTHIAA